MDKNFFLKSENFSLIQICSLIPGTLSGIATLSFSFLPLFLKEVSSLKERICSFSSSLFVERYCYQGRKHCHKVVGFYKTSGENMEVTESS